MKFKLGISLLLIILTLTACFGHERLHFQGESKHWEVEFEADIKGESSESTSYTIRYIGDDDPPEEISYQVGSGSGNVTLQNGVLKSSGSYCSGCSITAEDQEIDAKVEWDEKTENITLKNE